MPNERLHPGWLQGERRKNLHYAFTIIHLEGYQFAECREDVWRGKQANIISNEGREKGTRESKMKRSKIFRGSSVPGFLKCCSNYTLSMF